MVETFEDQARAVRRALTGDVTKADRKHLECAARNLEAFGAFRKQILGLATGNDTDDRLEAVADAMIHLLHIPIPAPGS